MKYLIVFTTCFALLMQLVPQTQGFVPETGPGLSQDDLDILQALCDQIDGIKDKLEELIEEAETDANNISEEMLDCLQQMLNLLPELKIILLVIVRGGTLTRVQIVRLRYILKIFIRIVNIFQVYVEINVTIVVIINIVEIIIVFIFKIIRIIVIIVCDKDPHFMVQIEGSDDPVCFDVDGKQDDVMQLIQDPLKNVTVNAQLFELENSARNSFFDSFAIMAGDDLVYANRSHIEVNGHVMEWHSLDFAEGDEVTVYSLRNGMVEIDMLDGTVSILLAQHWNKKYGTFLGIYAADLQGLSTYTHGIIGQFHGRYVNIDGDLLVKKSKGQLSNPKCRSRGAPLEVTATTRDNYATSHKIHCWMAENQGKGLLDGSKEDYFEPNRDIFFRGMLKNLIMYSGRGGC